MKKIVIAADSFKGTISATDVCEIIHRKAKETFCDCEVIKIPIADGGEGTLDVFSEIEGYERIEKEFSDLNGERRLSKYLYNKDLKIAVIETAETSGLPISKSKDPMITTTIGMGEQIKDAIELGAERVVIALGGSGTNDGGVGMLFALGGKFYDKDGKEFMPVGGTLNNIKRIDMSGLDRYKNVSFTAMCDVENPPYGENGATYIYGRQKGATDETLPILDSGIKNLTELLSKERNEDYSRLVGGGAAGALGLAIKGGLQGKLEKGISVAINLTDLEEKVKNADLLITGEGKLDEQSFMGKVIDGVSNLAKSNNVPVVVIAGAVDVFDKKVLSDNGIVAAFSTVNKAEPFEKIKERSKDNLARTAENVFALIKAFEK